MNEVRANSFAVERRAPLEVITKFVIESQLWVAAAVTSLASYAARELGVAGPDLALISVFFSTLFIYNLDKSLDLAKQAESPFANVLWRPRWWKMHERNSTRPEKLSTRTVRARLLTVAAFVCLTVTLASGPISTALVVLAGGAVCSLYAVPLGARGLRLKDVPGTKSLFVGLSVACAVLVVPMAQAGDLYVSESTLWLFAFVATLTTVNATLFDVRDLHQDLRSGLASLPVLLGATHTRALLLVFAALGFSAVFARAPEFAAETAVCWTLCTVFCLVLSPRSPRAAYAWLVDGALFVPWLLA